MRTIEITTVDLSTKDGRLKWLEYKNSPNWKLLTGSIGTEVIFEKLNTND